MSGGASRGELRYEIRVRGRLSDAALTSFEGPVGDQAELHGVLDRVQALGLELLELRRVP